jgi:cell fate (sporulation/competence/biofilm development) regulator YlbF (YheA/YmcA/DUF963 family)
MPVDTQQILDMAEKLGDLIAQHPAVARFKAAQKSLSEDPEATRLLSDFERSLESLARQEQSGMPVSDAQQQTLQAAQARVASHLKIKALNLAQLEFVDLLRKVGQTYQKPLAASPSGAAGAPATARSAISPR